MVWLPRGIDPPLALPSPPAATAGCRQNCAVPRERTNPQAIQHEITFATRNERAQIVGGLSVPLAPSFLAIDPRVKHPNTGLPVRSIEPGKVEL
jgi:hypothetical protein